MLLEQLIQSWDRNCEECQSRQRTDEYQFNTCQPISRHQSQPRDNYNNRFDRSVSCDQPPPMQYQSTGLWCDAHKSGMHNTEDCVWLKRQNAQRNNHQDSGRQSYAAHPSTLDFHNHSNDI
uniref:Uncharacterized protein n=1 Tax=Romanomermis culicivorax TaxID=13658 RepID=A0A915JZ27_ROMCU